MEKFDDASELERLASILDAKAATCDALVNEHLKANEGDCATKQLSRAKNARHFAEVCRRGARKIKVRVKIGAFMAPALAEVIEDARKRFPTWEQRDVEKWWNHFESVGWVVGKNKPMRDWKRALHNGFQSYLDRHPGKARSSAPPAAEERSAGDPCGWTVFLRILQRPYKPYKYSDEWLQRQFLKDSKDAK